MPKYLVTGITGIAGFIGSYTTRYLLDRGDQLVALDHLNSFYDATPRRTRRSLVSSPDFAVSPYMVPRGVSK
jgi:nucleoside-diphosphate-sugar epimerase